MLQHSNSVISVLELTHCLAEMDLGIMKNSEKENINKYFTVSCSQEDKLSIKVWKGCDL